MGTKGLWWEFEGRISIILYLGTKMGGLEMGCGRRVTVTIEFGPLSFLTLQEIIKKLQCFFVAINGIRIVGIPTKCKKRRCSHASHKSKCQKPSPWR